MSRAPKPGGMFFSYDPLAYNPLINIYCRMATESARRTKRRLPPPILRWRASISPECGTANSGFRHWFYSLSIISSTVYIPTRTATGSESYGKRRNGSAGGPRCEPSMAS